MQRATEALRLNECVERGESSDARQARVGLSRAQRTRRRTALGFAPDRGAPIIGAVAGELGRLRGWPAERIRQEIADYAAAVGLAPAAGDGRPPATP